MALIVQKYGGSSLANADYIKRVARHLGNLKKKGNDIVAVVSAMGKTTDDLMKLAGEVSKNPDKRELDMLLSVGERISISLLALALQDMGFDAISFTGSQVGIITDTRHTRARILEIRADRLINELKKGKIVIIAGFQGVSINKEITTLGRGGSDTTAIALGAALKADRVELMKDVDGIMRADPAIVENPEVIREITYEEMEEMASLDAGVIKSDSIKLAEYYGIKVGIGSSITGKVGTIISDRSFAPDKVKSVTLEDELLFFNIGGKNLTSLITRLNEERIPMKNFHFDAGRLLFDISKRYEREVKDLLRESGNTDFETEKDFSVISFVGNGIKPGSEAAARIVKIINKSGLEYSRLHIVENRLSVAVNKKEARSGVAYFYNLIYNPTVKADVHA